MRKDQLVTEVDLDEPETFENGILLHIQEPLEAPHRDDKEQDLSQMIREIHQTVTRLEASLTKSLSSVQVLPRSSNHTNTVATLRPSAEYSVLGSLETEAYEADTPTASKPESKQAGSFETVSKQADSFETASNGEHENGDTRSEVDMNHRPSVVSAYNSRDSSVARSSLEATNSQTSQAIVFTSIHTEEAASMIRAADGALRMVSPNSVANAAEVDRTGMGRAGTTQSRRWKRATVRENEKRRGSTASMVGNAAIALSIQNRNQNTKPFTQRPWFGWFCGLVIISDSIVIAIETDDTARTGQIQPGFRFVGYAFSLWYLLELLMRIAFHRPVRKFFTGKEKAWNWFDIILIVASFADIIIQQIEEIRLRAVAVGRVLRAVRLFRVVRVLRIIRFMTFMREFHKLVLCLASSLQTLVCAMFLMSFVIFCFSVLFVQMVSTHVNKDDDWALTLQEEELVDAFGTVGKSMISLYMAITAGRNWGELAELLLGVDPWLRTCFFIYLAMGIFGLTNVVTAVFVESAMQATQTYRDLLVNERMLKERTNAKHMKEIFRSIDTDDSGAISLQEMQAYMADENLKLQEYFEALDLSASDTETLFNLLDVDGSGEVDVDEFCDGCMRLGGPAKSFDMNCMWYEQRRVNREVLRFIQHASMALHSLTRNSKMTERQTQDLLKAVDGSRKVLASAALGGNLRRNVRINGTQGALDAPSSILSLPHSTTPATTQASASNQSQHRDYRITARWKGLTASSPGQGNHVGEALSTSPASHVETRFNGCSVLPPTPEDQQIPAAEQPKSAAPEVW
eukprot:CAMPEP_0178374454 /NCGR_PEP_ID=MMETSP0689_2-20121128/2385_1 /TAXON_ID=160604 /ORGANISM="Amphidinium massartii, Strain CS-259" /LENGTH=799 /DNA_ID=CAMNT_0019994425 /DNA_START=24 /DNA_END=2420 /DNA_ORIENTATION=-